MKSFIVATLAAIASALPREAVNLVNPEAGVHVTHYNYGGTDLDQLAKLDQIHEEVVDMINLNSSSNKFYTSGKNTQIGATFEGYVKVPETGVWTFGTNSDDGTRLYIGDEKIIGNEGSHGMRERKGEIELEAGYHPIKIDFQQGGGPYGIKVMFGGPNTSYQVIPAANWFHAGEIVTAPQVSVSQWDSIDLEAALAEYFGSWDWTRWWSQISTEEGRELVAGEVADLMIAKFRAEKKGTLPEVCESGQKCRDDIWAKAKLSLHHELLDVLTRVNTKITNTWLANLTVLEENYRSQILECNANDYCECYEIDVNYKEVVTLKRTLERDVETLQDQLQVLVTKQQEILDTCADEYSESAVVVSNDYYNL